MKKTLSLSLVSLCFFLLQCEDNSLVNPHYPVEPSIEFVKIEFIETPPIGEFDTLKLKIKYRDGDSDLGLDDNYLEPPFNPYFFFLENGSGDTIRVPSGFSEIFYYESIITNPLLPGKLVTDETRLKPNYEYLPEYDPNSCLNYSYSQLLVSEESAVVDETYTIVDTLVDPLNKKYFLIEEALLYDRNENHFNIFVEYQVSDDGVDFTKFNWFEEVCFDYNGRFPSILDYRGTIKAGPFTIKAKTPWEGEISYSMWNSSFLALFQSKKLKLKITIKDQVLHTSNTIETPIFTLDEIRKD